MHHTLKSLLANPLFNEVKHSNKHYTANAKIIKQDEWHENFYFILKGKVRVMIGVNIEGQGPVKSTIAELGEGDTFGEFGLFDNDFYANAEVAAINDVSLVEIDTQSFKEFLNKHPDFGYPFMLETLKILVKRLRQTDKTMVNFYIWGLKTQQANR